MPYSGFYVTAGYFLTGRKRRAQDHGDSLAAVFATEEGGRSWAGAHGSSSAGSASFAWAEKIFTAGFADPNRWSASAVTTELGVNWYWDEYTKIYMFWLHGEFGSPVQYGPGGYQKATDMFLAALSALLLRVFIKKDRMTIGFERCHCSAMIGYAVGPNNCRFLPCDCPAG